MCEVEKSDSSEDSENGAFEGQARRGGRWGKRETGDGEVGWGERT